MVVMGNPPYAVSSSNKGDWIADLLQDYKKDLKERNIQPLSDDYIKFTRYGQHFVDKNGEGILAYISNNSFIDGIIHRQMRKSLLERFDSIYIIDLHGNSKKQETALGGSKDENVFDIMQGVSINIFVKASNKKGLAQVYHLDMYGKLQEKYQQLQDNTLGSLDWTQLDCRAPEYFFVPKDFKVQQEYQKGVSINDLFPVNSSGIKTHRDHFVIDINKDKFSKRIQLFTDFKNSTSDLISELELKETSSWNITDALKGFIFEDSKIQKILYRPFYYQSIYYDSCLIDRGRKK